jgi:hypothetical protein
VNEFYCGIDGRGHVTVLWIQEAATDYQAAYARKLKSLLP